MGCFKFTYQDEDTSLGQNWKVYASGVEKTASNRNFRIDYYPGGMAMPGRVFNSNSYRYGYQGSEKDNEITGIDGAHITTLYREGDTRLLRWWSIDPKASLQPWQSPYNYMDGNPILKNDPDGDCPWCITAGIGAVVGAAVEYTGQVIGNVANGNSLTDIDTYTNIDVADIVIAAGEGAVIGLTGGLGAAGKLGTTTIKVVNTTTKILAATGQAAVDSKVGQQTTSVFDGTKDGTTAVVEGIFNLAGSAVGGKSPVGTTKVKGSISAPSPKEAVKAARAKAPVNRVQRIATQAKAVTKQKATDVANKTLPTFGTAVNTAGKATSQTVFKSMLGIND